MKLLAQIAALVWAGAAWADCVDERDAALALLGVHPMAFSDAGTLTGEEGTCLLEDVVFGQGDGLKIEIAALNWRASGLDALKANPDTPLSIDLTVTGLHVLPQTGDPWLDYSQRLQTRRNIIDGRFVARWDPVTGAVDIDRLAIALMGRNGLELVMRVTGADAILSAGWVQAAPAVRLERLTFSVENEGVMDGLIIGAILGQLTSLPGSPETVVNGTLREMQGLVALWPETIFPERSRAALIRLLQAGPLPWGRFELRLAEGAVSLDRLLGLGLHPDPLGPEALAAAFDGAVFSVSFAEASVRR
jgi:hypothetical protein